MPKIKLKDIVRDPRLQLRANGLDESHVVEIMEAMKAGRDVGKVHACKDHHGVYPYDGWHRIEAASRRGDKEIDAEVEPGDLDDAALKAAAANAGHGLKRTNDDKRNAVRAILDHPDAKDWSDRKIAEYAGVSNNFVATVRSDQLSSDDSSSGGEKPITRVGRDGKRRKVSPSQSKPKAPQGPSQAAAGPKDSGPAAATSTAAAHQPANGKATDPLAETVVIEPGNPFPAQADAMKAAARKLSWLAGEVEGMVKTVHGFDGEGYEGLDAARENIEIALGNVAGSLKTHAGTLTGSAPAGICLDCGGAGCLFCSQRRYQTERERKEAESRRKARGGAKAGAAAR